MSNYYSINELISLGVNIDNCEHKSSANIKVSKLCSIYNPKNLFLCNNCRIDDFTILSGAGIIKIGNYVHISSHCFISSTTNIIIGDFSSVSVGCKLFGGCDDFSGEYLANPTVPKEFTNVTIGDIIIHENVIIGANSVIMPKTTFEVGSAIGANSFVGIGTTCIEFYIYAGSPIKQIKQRSQKGYNMIPSIL